MSEIPNVFLVALEPTVWGRWRRTSEACLTECLLLSLAHPHPVFTSVLLTSLTEPLYGQRRLCISGFYQQLLGGPWSILTDSLPGSSGRTSFPSLRAGYLFLMVLKFRLMDLFCYCSSPGVRIEAETLASCPEYLLALGTSHFCSQWLYISLRAPLPCETPLSFHR